jgi:hypothetical protein
MGRGVVSMSRKSNAEVTVGGAIAGGCTGAVAGAVAGAAVVAAAAVAAKLPARPLAAARIFRAWAFFTPAFSKSSMVTSSISTKESKPSSIIAAAYFLA